ncbi:cytochrome c/FTR1 family iron permease [Salinimicrobium flavum]|uniref:Cytochrome c/FTR1 family iron permease n=1 Tax=Salinimicrobium flavum TaxID=1737065 RepID=A0ABW5ISJ6_9FLAO
MYLKTISITFLITGVLFLSNSVVATATSRDDNTQMAIHLLDYIARDYATAVKDGKIINAAEYKEMLEFSTTVYELLKPLKNEFEKEEVDFLSQVEQLKILIQEKAGLTKVAELAQKIRLELIEVTGYQVAPLHWPDHSRGKQLYAKNCLSCHGEAGNGKGPLAQSMDPTPTNFLNDKHMEQVSPFQAYNTIRLGVEGTEMKAFPELKDEEVWDLAFYIKSLRFERSGNQKARNLPEEVNLTDVASLSDLELLNKLGDDRKKAKEKIKIIRLHIPDTYNSLDLAKEYLNSALLAYTEGETSLARKQALAAYLEGVEPVEVQLRAKDPAFMVQLEKQMFELRSTIEKKKSLEAVTHQVNLSLEMIARAGTMMKGEKLGFWLAFILTVSILLREGIEAFLIIAVVLTIIRSARMKKALPWLHGGWITAVLLGFAGWYMSDFLLQLSGQNREILEGIVTLLAVLVLTYVGFWLHSNSHAKRWKVFIEKRIQKLLKTENMWGLAFFSFMVVFREAFESVLFLQAIKLETIPGNQSSIGLGVLVAFSIIAVLVVLFVKYSQKIPIRQLFLYSSWMIVLLALILMGKGIHSIQESGLLSVTMIPIDIRIEWLGIYSSAESLLGQGLLLILILSLWYNSPQRNKNISTKK